MQRLSELFNVNNFIVSQTNPWVIPFINTKDEEGIYNTEKGRFNFWQIFKSLIYSEIKHRIQQVIFLVNQQIQSLGILPTEISRMINLITQQYH